jgi:hypothetical protein
MKRHWKENAGKLLLPAPRKEGFAYSRNNLVRSGLKPIFRKLGIPEENVDIHAFRHGLATELAESAPITVFRPLLLLPNSGSPEKFGLQGRTSRPFLPMNSVKGTESQRIPGPSSPSGTPV